MNVNSTSSSANTTDYSRITGLATGMDTDGMVKSMMAADQIKIDKAKQNQQYTEWQQEAYIETIKDLKDFYSSYLDILGSADTNMMKSTAYNGLKAALSDTDNSSKLSVSTYPGAIKGNYSLKINQLSSGAKQEKLISDINSTVTTDGNIEIKIGTLDASNNNTIMNTFSIPVTSGMKMSEVIDKLKSAADSSGNSILNYVNINYSEITGKLTIETKDTGSTQTLNITDTSNFGFATPTTDESGNEISYITGADAKVQIKAPGETDFSAEITKSSNNFIIDNLKFSLQDVTTNGTTDIDTDDTPISFNVTADATDSIAKIKKFVDSYNSLIDKINSKITEKKDYDYKPLTDVQKESMTEDQIKKWEEQAKKGIFKNEMNLSNLLFTMRQSLYNTVSGAGINITDIGISTSSVISEGGKLKIDEDKLKTALETRSDQVYKLFAQSGSTDETKGILQRFKDAFNDNIGSDGILIQKAGYEDTRWVVSNDLSKSIENQKQKIADMLEMFNDKQQRYYNMFAVLESNMNQLNSQSSWLTSMLSS